MTPPHRGERRTIGILPKLGAALTAIAIAFGLCEIGVRVFTAAPPQPAREPQLLFRPDPDVGFIHVPNQQGWLDDGMATINALGLRGELPAVPKADGALRILAVGDSTTFGWGVGDNETYCFQLERLLRHEFPGRRVDVVNAGVSAYDLEHDARLLSHFTPMLTPDIVLVGLYWNDLPYETVSPEGVPQPPAAEASAAGVAAAGALPKTFRLGNQPSGWNRVLRSSRVLYALRHAWLGAIAPTSAATNQVRWEMALLDGRQSPAIEHAWADVKATLQEIRDFGQANGLAVGVVTMPIRAQVEGWYPRAEYQTRVRSIAESVGLFIVDPLPYFLRQTDHKRLFLPFDRIHFSGQGNAAVADAVFEVLRARPEFGERRRESPGGTDERVR